MADRRTINGTPWHVGFVNKDEEDPRRHKARCIYYTKETKICKALNFRCFGAAHCSRYKEYENIEETKTSPKKEVPEYIKRALEDLKRKEKQQSDYFNSKPSQQPYENEHQSQINTKQKRKTKYQIKNENIELPEYAFIGAWVCHEEYGPGVVYSVEKRIISIIFDNGKDFKIDYPTATEINTIKLMN